MDTNKKVDGKPLAGKVALVAGATRGAGRGIASMLGEAGASVYCTGRSTRKNSTAKERPECIEDTAEMVTAYGGEGIAVRVDHSIEHEVVSLFDRIKKDHGRLDILVNDIWGGDPLTEWGTPFWELSLEKGFAMIDQAIKTHIITSRHGVPLMVDQGAGLVVEITDGNHQTNRVYRSNLFYDFVKAAIIRMAFGMAEELKQHNVTALALTPGFLRSEAMLDHFGVTEKNWKDGAEQDPHFIASETPFFVGRAVASLAADPDIHKKAGLALSSWELAREYGFTDMDGSRPDWEAHISPHYPEMFS
ncbi:MAG: SDR family oxidoreductase [Rhodothermales bacterium]